MIHNNEHDDREAAQYMSAIVEMAIEKAKEALVEHAEMLDDNREKVSLIMISTMNMFEDMLRATLGERDPMVSAACLGLMDGEAHDGDCVTGLIKAMRERVAN